ncbi:hypothetical protein IF2G_11007 [Cordyceps javanica]|nr:hypothetical protein IF2G_11007 [Cordyceps javanica]
MAPEMASTTFGLQSISSQRVPWSRIPTVDESAIDDDDSSDWEDSVQDSGKSSVDANLFQRVKPKANLVSRRSLITLVLAPLQSWEPLLTTSNLSSRPLARASSLLSRKQIYRRKQLAATCLLLRCLSLFAAIFSGSVSKRLRLPMPCSSAAMPPTMCPTWGSFRNSPV